MTATAAWNFKRLRDAATATHAQMSVAPVAIGKYQIQGEIARGAMGIVYLADDPELRRRVAIKVLRDLPGPAETIRQRFQREAQSAAKLSHPNVVRVYDSGEDAGRIYLVMEYVDGHPLSVILGQRKYELRPMLELLIKVARGVEAAHREGVVHRDLKPANILVTLGGEPKVGDFGLAHWMDSDLALTKSGTPMGTPMYMSPEQVRGESARISPATDVYALGGILYEILTGRPPHTGDSSMDLYARIVGSDPTPPRRLSARVPRDLETICMAALEKEPSKRYADAGKFADDLRRHLDGDPILARPPGGVARAIKWVRRHRMLSAAAGSAALGLAGIAIVLALGASKKRADLADYMDQGRLAMSEYHRLEADLAADRRTEQRLQAELDPAADFDGRRPLWTLRFEMTRKEGALALRVAEVVRAFTQARTIDPALPEARTRLAEIYYAEYERAEKAGDLRSMEVLQALVLSLEPSWQARFLRSGLVAIESRPAGAVANLLQYRKAIDGRLVAEEVRSLGPCPVARTSLPAGSYLVILRMKGYRDTRVPLWVRNGSDQSAAVTLCTEEEIGKDFVYVPGGPFTRGGDPQSAPATPAETVEVGDFFIGLHEVTLAEYLPFLDQAIADLGPVEAQKRAPRTPQWIEMRIRSDADHAELPEGWDKSWPVFGISCDNAEEFVRWRTRRAELEGEPATYRLPTDLEWEKAARGVDGRCFPWGDVLEPGFAKLPVEGEVKIHPAPVGTYDRDESPYGVRDMAGNVAEWTATWWKEPARIRMLCGGSWINNLTVLCRCASRSWMRTPTVDTAFGLRLVRVPVR